MSKRLIRAYTFNAAAGTIKFRGNYNLKAFLLVTNVTDNIIIYNFADASKGGTSIYSNQETTLTLDYDTSAMSDTDELQIFIDVGTTIVEPIQSMTDPVERMRVANPQALIDTDFEYSLQPTKWETLQTQNNIPSVYQKSNEPAFTSDQIISITTASVESTPSVAGVTYDTSLESLFYDTAAVATGQGTDGTSIVTLAVNNNGSTITCVGKADAPSNATTMTLPGGLSTGDVIFYYGAADGGIPATPTGFTSVTSINGNVDTRLAYSVIIGVPPTQITGLTNNGQTVHGVVILRNVDTTDIINAQAQVSTGNQYANPPAVTTDEDGCAILTFVGIDDDEFADEMVASVNFDLLMSANSGAGNRSSMNIAMYIQPTAGTIDPGQQGYVDGTYVSANVSIPFSVTVLGTTFTNVNFNSEGVMFFNTADAITSDLDLSSATYVASPHLKIFAQALTAAKIGVTTTGTSPNRKRIIKYEITDDTSAIYDYTNVAYIVFTEGTNDIQIHYYKNRITGTTQLSNGTSQVLTWTPPTNVTGGDFNSGFIVRDAYQFNLSTVVRDLIKVEVNEAPVTPFAVGDPITLKETKDPVYLDGSNIIVQATGSTFYLPNLSPAPYVGNQATDFTIIYTGGFYFTSEIPYTKVESIVGTKQVRITFSTPPSLFLNSTIFVVDSLSTDIDWIGPFRINKVLSSTEYEFLALRDTNYGSTATLSSGTTKIYTSNQGAAQHRYFDGGVQISPETTAPNARMIRQTRNYFRYQSGKGIQFSTGVLFKPTYDIASYSINTNGYDPNAVEPDPNGTYTMTIETEQYHGFGLPSSYRPGAEIELTGFEVTSGANYNVTASISNVNSAKTFQIDIPVTGSNPITDLNPGGIAQVVVRGWNDATVRTGMFDDQNGLFLEHDGQELYAVRRNSTQQLAGFVTIAANDSALTGTNTKFKSQLAEGDYVVIKGSTYLVTDIVSDTSLTIAPDYKGPSITDTKIVKVSELRTARTEFNIDQLDGTGPSGYIFDANKMQMVFIDYSWYGAGKIRYGMRGLDGEIFYFHDYINNNNNTEAYMRSGNLPGRFEITTKGINGKIQRELADDDTTTSIPTSIANRMPSQGTIVIKDEYMEYSKGAESGTNTILNLDNRNVGFLSDGNVPVLSPELTAFQTVNQNLSPVLSHWGVSVIMDGRFDEDKSYLFTAQNQTTRTIPAGESIPLITIRIAPSVDYGIPSFFGIRNLINRSSIILKTLGVVTDGQVALTARINANSTYYESDSSWLEVGNGSISQYADHELDLNDYPISDGDLVASFLTDEGTNRLSATYYDISDVRNLGNSILGGPNVFPDGPDTLVISVRNLGVTACNAAASIAWIESQG
jgi:hypothetical protein